MIVHDPSFKEWLSNFAGSDTNIGDLARDVARDFSFPDTSHKPTLLKYIRRKTRNPAVEKTLSAAIDLYHAADAE